MAQGGTLGAGLVQGGTLGSLGVRGLYSDLGEGFFGESLKINKRWMVSGTNFSADSNGIIGSGLRSKTVALMAL